MSERSHRCPDCGLTVDGPSTLVDHALSAHVQAPTAAGHLRRPKRAWVRRGAGGLGVLVGIAFWVGVVLAAAGVFDKASAPQRPSSEAHRMAVELRRSGAIDEFRSVEPDSGWGVEYELDEGEGAIRTRNLEEELEYEASSVDLEEEIERIARKRDFDVGR